MAVAEEACQFEHRDLHWGNLLIRRSEEPAATAAVGARLRGVDLEAGTSGVTVSGAHGPSWLCMLGEGVSGPGVWTWRQHQQRGDELGSADCSQAKPADAMLLAAARPSSLTPRCSA